ncbi:MAG: hypothetical protein GF332_04295 [Candidatus Moranbacteria bacterium]|nr:hypothetical protein [Candidatus Moranbacteria bacterium]
MYNLKKINKGFDLVTVPIVGIKSVTVMALFGVGSKYETESIRGISHFIEHSLFNGTKKRPSAREISQDLDRVGGQYNAFTGKEYTGYYVKVGSQYLDLGLDWLSDLLISPLFEKSLIEKEKRVIIEEINMYEDTPMQHISDVYESLVYGDQPAGWDIIGTKATVKKMTRTKLINFKKKYYKQNNCVICIAGKFDQKKVEQKFLRYFAKLEAGQEKVKKKPVKDRQYKARKKLKFKETDQSHCVTGFRAFDIFDSRKHVLNVLNAVLGGGMSSRLFSEIRDKRGLAYYITSEVELYTDSGYIAAQAGVDNKKLTQAIELIIAEYNKLKRISIGSQELDKVKNFLKGQSLLAMESSNAQAMYYANQMILTGKIETLEEKFKSIDAVTSKQVQELAQELFIDKNLNVAVIGPGKHQNGQRLEQIFKNGFEIKNADHNH